MEYDVAFSFAGEDRKYVEAVAQELIKSGIRVFYDNFETVNLWGKDLYTHLQNVYQKQAKYTVIFISENYAKKLWTNHERKMAQARAFTESREYILPARFDDTEIEGITSTIGYIDLRNFTPQDFSNLIRQKVDPEKFQTLVKDRLAFTVPIAINISNEISKFIDKTEASKTRFREGLSKVADNIYYDLGVSLPNFQLNIKEDYTDNKYYILLKEVPVSLGNLYLDRLYINDSAENIRVFDIDAENVNYPTSLCPGAWIPAEQRHIAETAGLKVWEPADVILLHLSRILHRYAHDFIGIEEAQGYLDFVSRAMPKLVEETIGRIITIHQYTDVLQRLVQEGISIRDMKSILDALSEWGRIEKDPVMLTEHIRAAMRRYISFHYARGSDTLFVYLLDPEIEDIIRGAIRRTSTGYFLSLDPVIAHDIVDAIRLEIGDIPPTAQPPVIVTDMELRRFVRKIVELEFSNLAVLSYQELAPEIDIQPIGRILIPSTGKDSANPENDSVDELAK